MSFKIKKSFFFSQIDSFKPGQSATQTADSGVRMSPAMATHLTPTFSDRSRGQGFTARSTQTGPGDWGKLFQTLDMAARLCMWHVSTDDDGSWQPPPLLQLTWYL